MTGGNQGTGFQMVADFDGDIDSLFEVSHDGEMPIIATRNIVLHPGVLTPIMVTRESTLALVKRLKKKPDLAFAVICQKDPNVDEPELEDLYEYGVFGKLVKIFDIPGMGSNVTIVIQALSRCHLESITKKSPFLMGELTTAKEQMPEKNDTEYKMAIDDVKKKALEYVQNNEDLPNEAQFAVTNISNEILCINFMCTNLPFSIDEKAKLLGMPSMKLRAFQLLGLLNRELQLLELKNSIRHRTEEKINEEQKEYFLRQQIKNIRKELGGDGQSAERKKLMRQAAEKIWSNETKTAFEEELNKLDAIQPQSPDYNIQLTYLQQILALPWDYRTEDNLNLARAEKKLDQDHYGMEKVKERILEYISVLKLRGNLKSPILCLYGPPGVGKTSLGKSIADSLQRKYVRISLGGLHDESEIRGHRKTYIGAMPGRIIKGIQKAGSSNPVFILDEIDKVTPNTHQGDPASALLEVLDPEQNNAFHDNYLDMDYDLSNVMFIATANDISNILSISE